MEYTLFFENGNILLFLIKQWTYIDHSPLLKVVDNVCLDIFYQVKVSFGSLLSNKVYICIFQRQFQKYSMKNNHWISMIQKSFQHLIKKKRSLKYQLFWMTFSHQASVCGLLKNVTLLQIDHI